MKIILILPTFLLIILINNSSAQITFQKKYALNGSNSATDIVKTSDGGYIIAGFIQPTTSGTTDVLLIKTNEYGDTLWTGIYGGTSDDGARSVQQTRDGGYIVNCFTSSFGDLDYLLKTDANGNLLWSKTYSNSNPGEGESVIETLDGGFIITGEFISLISGIFIIKTDANGNIEWSKENDAEPYSAYSILQTSDSGYVLTGNVPSMINGNSSIFLLKINSVGDTLWTKTFEDGDMSGNCIRQTNDGGFIIAGHSFSSALSFTDDIYLLKTDSIGNLLWARTIGNPILGDENSYSVEQTTDGGYILAGSLRIQTLQEAIIVKTDSIGQPVWGKIFGNSGFDGARSIKQTNDGGFIFAGYTTDITTQAIQVYLTKLDANGSSNCNDSNIIVGSAFSNPSLGNAFNIFSFSFTATDVATTSHRSLAYSTFCSSVGIHDASEDSFVQLFPNPSNGKSEISFGENYISGKIEIINSLGLKIYSEEFFNKPFLRLDLQKPAAGIYFLTIFNDKIKTSRKIVFY